MPLQMAFDRGRTLKSYWDDVAVPATATRQGSNLKPDFDYTNIGLLFPRNDTTEKVYLIYQMPHRKALGTPIRYHLHYTQTTANQPTFTMEYRYYNNGSLVPATWTTLDTSLVKGVFTWASGTLLNIAKFPEIPPPPNEKVSANLDVILYRNDNLVVGDVLVKFIDLHCLVDTFGSQTEFSKTPAAPIV